ncbi:15023_t:CDS:2 [Funneliformis geosporum]|nr:15023_t:CDS:2 [Funneliformis geosporum]
MGSILNTETRNPEAEHLIFEFTIFQIVPEMTKTLLRPNPDGEFFRLETYLSPAIRHTL